MPHATVQPSVMMVVKMGSLSEILFGRRPAPTFPSSVAVAQSVSDEGDELHVSSAQNIPDFLKGDKVAGLTFAIEYKGDTRRITLRRVDPQEGGYLHIIAYCHEAMGLRTFRSDRIRHLIDWQTGEVFTDVAGYISYLTDLAQIGLDPEADQRRAQDRVRSGITILMFLARIDGHVHPAEAAVVRAYIQAACETISPRVQFYNLEKLVDYALRSYPEPDAFKLCVNRVSTMRWKTLAHLTANAAEQIIKADGRIDDNERAVLSAVKAATEGDRETLRAIWGEE